MNKEEIIFKECIELGTCFRTKEIHRVNLLDKFSNKDVRECVNSLVKKGKLIRINRDNWIINKKYKTKNS